MLHLIIAYFKKLTLPYEDAYLSQAVDIYDLEKRMHSLELQQSGCNGY